MFSGTYVLVARDAFRHLAYTKFLGEYLRDPKSIPPLGNGFCRFVFGLADNGNGYLLSERGYGAGFSRLTQPTWEWLPAVEVGLEGAPKGLQKTVMISVRSRPKLKRTPHKGAITILPP